MPDIQIQIDQSASPISYRSLIVRSRQEIQVWTCLISSWEENLISDMLLKWLLNRDDSSFLLNWSGRVETDNQGCLIAVTDPYACWTIMCIHENKKAQRKWARYKNDFVWIKIQNCQILKSFENPPLQKAFHFLESKIWMGYGSYHMNSAQVMSEIFRWSWKFRFWVGKIYKLIL